MEDCQCPADTEHIEYGVGEGGALGVNASYRCRNVVLTPSGERQLADGSQN